MKIKSLGIKTSLVVALVIVALVVIIFLVISSRSSALVKSLVEKEAKSSNIALVREVQNLQDEALSRAKLIGATMEVIDAVESKDDVALKAALLELNEGIDTIMVTDTEGNVIVRAHSDQKGDNVLSQTIVSTTLNTGKGMSTIAKGATVGMATRGSAVIKDHNGKIIGAVVCGHDLSKTDYVDSLKATNGCEATIFDGDTRLNTTLKNEKGERAVGTKASEIVKQTVIDQKKEYSLQIPLFGANYSAYYSPLIIDGNVIGMLFTGVNIDMALQDEQAMIRSVLIAGIICGVACVALVFILNIFLVSRPLKKIGLFASKFHTGDLGIATSETAVTGVRSSDEVGALAKTLEQSYTQLRGYVGEIKERMQGLAEGDLVTESTYDFQGDFVLIKESINGIIDNLNRTIAEVNTSAIQVSTGSSQIASGAQSLAQGATEQAASIEELSSAISEIATKTKENTEIAAKTSVLSETIKENAEKGSRQMDEMISAVKGINEASQSINKIIKTIDDIAFQTNILALNAAVEAARAGQHGKGFAVVAEEVRNLASKSAEAAKETGNMIQNSMEKAETGSRIAGETAASLTEIVSGIRESSRYIADIAEASNEQLKGITQINVGVDQVAQVIQQNSATAEEAAASSEEMSSQSALLQGLIAQFRIKNEPEGYRSLPSAEKAAKNRYTAPKMTGAGYADSGAGDSFGKY